MLAKKLLWRAGAVLSVFFALHPSVEAVCTAANPNADVPELTPTGHFIVHANSGGTADGTVTHTKTGLMWKRCAQGQTWTGSDCTGTVTLTNWAGALAAAASESFAGYTDWRLPSVAELDSIVESCGYNPSINTFAFKSPTANIYWTSTTAIATPSSAWGVYFYAGKNLKYSKTTSYAARLVRGGGLVGSFDRWGPDTHPDAFSFNSQTGVPPGSLVTSNPITVSGISAAATISVSGGAYAINGGSYTLASGTVNNGDTVTLRQNASAFYGGTATATLTIDIRNASFVVTTIVPTPPSPPKNVVATRGNASASIAFDPPTNDGGAPVSNYRATCGAFSAQGSASPINVTGLTNGSTYSCTAAAYNFAGWGSESTPPSLVTPATVPAAPTGLAAVPGDGSVSISFSVPGNNGGASIDSYRGTCGASAVQNSASPVTVTGLSNGTIYTCTVAAHNSVGWGAESVPSNAVMAAPLPGAPTGVSALARPAGASLSFTAPVGGLGISSYTATCNASGHPTGVAARPGSPIRVYHLDPGILYACSVTATNGTGTGAASAPTTVTPLPRSQSGMMLLLLD